MIFLCELQSQIPAVLGNVHLASHALNPIQRDTEIQSTTTVTLHVDMMILTVQFVLWVQKKTCLNTGGRMQTAF